MPSGIVFDKKVDVIDFYIIKVKLILIQIVKIQQKKLLTEQSKIQL